MSNKPRPPYPRMIMRIMRKILSHDYFIDFIGRHEKTSLSLWGILSEKLLTEKVIFDIGAYHGEFAIQSRKSNINIKVVAFEPNPISFEKIKSKCKGLNIDIEKIAVSDKVGHAIFSINEQESSIVSENISDNSIRVNATTIDHWSNKNNVIPSLIKMDTEGTEHNIIKGAKTVLHKYGPIILCEVLTDEQGKNIEKILPSKYCYFHIDEKYGRVTEKKFIDRKLWRNVNWFFVPKDKKKYFKDLIRKSIV